MGTPIGIIKAIDELYTKKQELKLLETEVDELSSTIKDYMKSHQLKSIDGKKAQAVFNTREVQEIDPEAYWEVLEGDVDKFLSSVTVRLEPNATKGLSGARSYLGKDIITSICSIIEVPVLLIKKLKAEKPIPVGLGTGARRTKSA